MASDSSLSELKNRYTLDHPNKGKVIFYVALAAAIYPILACSVMYFIHGPAGMQAWWEAGVLDGNKSPLRLAAGSLNILAILIVIWHSVTIKGWRLALTGIFCGFFIAWFYEFLGTNTVSGGIFGPYHYNSETLGQHIFGVPFGVALSWETFGYPSFYLALYLMPSEALRQGKSFFRKVCNIAVISTLGGLFCVVVDFLIDPISVAQGFFTWHVKGDSIYMWLLGSGEPLTNYLGWWICGFTMMVAFCFILQTNPDKRQIRSKYLDIYIPLALYCAWFTTYFSLELFFQQRGDVIMFSIFGQGGLILLCLVKLYLEKQGSQPHLLGQMISQEAVRKCMEKCK